ncbi:endoplasmic reticulum junction formation protein lunapark isoform X4 [Dendropsophus ebraccatus]|uniref:endoplasmic reticulum junction formation protein lunapark isoform X4 n=1 Tax=Dendropsophus ebraccatus TaxID=150705 RepID=UPI003831AE59
MGALLSRWKAKPSTVEVLEKMEKEIQSLEEFQEKNQKLRKIWVGRLLLYSIILYLLTCFVVYLWYLPVGLTARLLIIIPFLLFPVIIWFARTLLIVWFSKRTERNNEALEDLKAQKKKILEEVMEKETYKAAKLILERFDPESKKIKELEPPAGTPITPRPGQALHPPGPPLARPILPRERGAVDRVIEYLVGDGPQNRSHSFSRFNHMSREELALGFLLYALICQQCFSHNGMALKEEFEYVAFRCAYCFFLNPARKTRPQAPRLQELNLERKLRTDSQSSTSMLQAATEELENQTSSDPSEVEETPDTEEAVGEEEEKGTEEVPADIVEETEASPEVVPPANVNESEESFMETE